MNVAAWLPRVLAVLTAFLVAKAAELGFTLQAETVTAIMLMVYALAHRTISKSVNPGDSIKTVLVEEEKAVVKASE